jgi:hypothetical protein
MLCHRPGSVLLIVCCTKAGRFAVFLFAQIGLIAYNTAMSTAINSQAFNRGIDPILRLFTPDQAREIVNFRGDEELQRRIEELALRANEGVLSEEEHSEYEGYVQANKFVVILQAKARKLLSDKDA